MSDTQEKLEEFETWKGSRGLSNDEYSLWIMRRRKLSALCRIYLEAYKNNEISPNHFIDKLASLCGSKDEHLFGHTVLEAAHHRALKGRPSTPSRLRQYMRASMKNRECSHRAAPYLERLELLEKELFDCDLIELGVPPNLTEQVSV